MLYTVRVLVGDDDQAERIGFRTVKVKDKQIMLNGKPLYLQGVNRHEEHPEWGFAFPLKLMGRDLDIIEDLSCNSIRGSHYPQSAYWLDLLDERGIVFWSEIPLWQYHAHHMTDPVIRERSLRMLEEMIEHNFHHPSVLFDVIGINKYFGWYGGEVEGFAPFLEKYHDYAASVGAKDKPIILAEFGAAGLFGDVGWEERRLFSEDYQADVLQKALTIFRNDRSIVGTFVWQFADIRSDTRMFRDRARSFNNKGLVNEYRKPKLAYREVRRIYRQKASNNGET